MLSSLRYFATVRREMGDAALGGDFHDLFGGERILGVLAFDHEPRGGADSFQSPDFFRLTPICFPGAPVKICRLTTIGHPDLFFYGVHTAEALYAVMGRGCESVTRTFTEDTDVTVGIWSGGRIGVLHALRTGPLNTSTTGVIPHQVTVFGTGGSAAQERDDGTLTYTALLEEIVRFFQTRIAPVDPEETLELFAFLEAAQRSRERGGVPVLLAELA
jgi:hypothetical protein